MSRRYSNAAVAQRDNGYLSPPASGSRDKCTCAHSPSEDELDDPFIVKAPRVCKCGAAERRVIPPASEGLASNSPAGPSTLGAQQGDKRKRAAPMPAWDNRYMTYVFRGTRVTYATRASSEDSDEEPYVPRLLFPHAHRSSEASKRAAAAAAVPSPATSTTSASTSASGLASPTATHSTGATSCQSHDEVATAKPRSPRYTAAAVPAPSKRPNLFASQIEQLRQQAEEKHAAARASGKPIKIVEPHGDLTRHLEAWSDSEDDDDQGDEVQGATARARATQEYWATYEKSQAAQEEMQQPEPFYPQATSYKRETDETQQAPRKKRCVR